MIKIHTLHAFADNFIFLIHLENEKDVAVVDPGDPKPVIQWFDQNKEYRLTHILATHHHADHIGGVVTLKQLYPDAEVWCSQEDAHRHRIPKITRVMKDQETFTLFGQLKGKVLHVPGHTLGHIVFFLQDGSMSHAFCGDTVFGCGCGKLFEGTFEMMFTSLQKIKGFPPSTLIWCAHEYTVKNIQVALELEPGNKKLAERLHKVTENLNHNIPSIPFTLEEECATSPFLRFDDPSLQAILETSGNPLKTFTKVRQFRDQF